jgi:hypothetical protein
LTPKTIRENVTYISLHRGAGSLADIKRIISLYTKHSDSIAPIIDDLTRKKEFIVFDHKRPKDDPLSIRVRWDTSISKYSDALGPAKGHDLRPILDGSSMISDALGPISKFSLYGQKVLKDAKGNGSLIDIAKNMPAPNNRKKLLAKGVRVKNSTIWAKYVYREAFNIKGKDLGPDWVKFADKLRQEAG